MLVSLPAYLQKLWDKGIDISEGILVATVSAGIATAIALLGWKIKLHFDLKAEDERRRLRRAERRARLEQEREALAGTLAAAILRGDLSAINSTVLNYETWLQKYELLPVNAHLLNSVKEQANEIKFEPSLVQAQEISAASETPTF